MSTGSPRPTLFLSDLHLSPDRPAAVAAFHAFAAGPARAAAAVSGALWGVFLYWWAGILYALQAGRLIRIPRDAAVPASDKSNAGRLPTPGPC